MKAVVLALLRSLDIVLCVIWLGPLYLIGLADRPTGNETISAYVGTANKNGHRWARIAAAVIDWGALKLGDGPDHCARAAEHYGRLK